MKVDEDFIEGEEEDVLDYFDEEDLESKDTEGFQDEEDDRINDDTDEDDVYDEDAAEDDYSDEESIDPEEEDKELSRPEIEKLTAEFESYLNPNSPFSVRIAPNLIDWKLQWERFKEYARILHDPDSSQKERAEVVNTIQIELLPLVKKVAAGYYRTYINANTYEDILVEGQVGIQASYLKYDPAMSPPSHFFKREILHAITVYVQTQLMNSSRVNEQNANKIAKAKKSLISAGIKESEITPAMLSRKTRLPVSTVESVLLVKTRQGTVPLPEDKAIASHDPESDPAKAYEMKMQQEDVQLALSSLTELERDIVERIYMCQDTISEVAATRDLTAEEVGLILNRATKKLKQAPSIQSYRHKQEKVLGKPTNSIPMLPVRKSMVQKFFSPDEIDDPLLPEDDT